MIQNYKESVPSLVCQAADHSTMTLTLLAGTVYKNQGAQENAHPLAGLGDLGARVADHVALIKDAVQELLLRKPVDVGSNVVVGRHCQAVARGGTPSGSTKRDRCERSVWEVALNLCNPVPNLHSEAASGTPAIGPCLRRAHCHRYQWRYHGYGCGNL